MLENADSKHAPQISNSLSNTEKSEIFGMQKLRYKILKLSYGYSNNLQKGVVNLFEIGKILGADSENLQKIYFYLHDEGLIGFHALGGDFTVTDKGKQLLNIENIDRIS